MKMSMLFKGCTRSDLIGLWLGADEGIAGFCACLCVTPTEAYKLLWRLRQIGIPERDLRVLRRLLLRHTTSFVQVLNVKKVISWLRNVR